MKMMIPISAISYRKQRRNIQEWSEAFKQLEHRYKELHELFVRERSSFRAYKQRAKQEKEIAGEIGQMKLIQSLLPVVDDLERAMFHSNLSPDDPALMEGIRLIYQNFLSILKQWGVQPLESVGEKVNPKTHEVVETISVADKEEGAILAELEKGYTFHGMLLRPAKVVVASKVGENAGGR